ncbi:MAG TPA: DEAD/DEAH box helicase [Nocardioides sp.]|uniref:DEAD/DEAH box helicase n=1 Tax=Nocardioides sp. TaxID=35761 RepID=UPI002D7F5B16|nr:DEAD/DEAH box helicase [Nocardioides sp.]HET6652254.1 DEAD/DEAH box helicase [Nocardioides sp.]
MVDLSVALDEADLARRFGAVTLERALDYVERGLVLEVSHEIDGEGDLDIRGRVVGSTSVPYQSYVAVGEAERGVWVYSRCSCPVGDGCKHALALLLVVRREHVADAEADGRRAWERRLTSVLDELDEGERVPDRATPLALQIMLSRTTSTFQSWSRTHAPARGTLRIRPLVRGARDNWVKSGATWQDVPYLDARKGCAPAQVAVLGELLAAYRAASRQTYFGSESHLPLAGFGASLWPLLRRAREVGITLVPGPGLARVDLHPDPLSIEVDANTSATGDTHLGVGVRLDGEWHAADDVDLLGDQGHGVAVWSPGDPPTGWVLVLAPLTKGVGPEVRRLVASGDTLVVPAADRHDLVADFLPRLRRHVPVTSSDGSVELPEPVMPRLALTVTWVSVERVELAWSWRYRAGDTDRVYAVGEARGLRGFRQPDRERQLLDELVLDDAAVHRLCRSRSRDRGLVPEAVLTGTDAIDFAVDVLPGLEAGGQVEISEIGARPDYRAATEAPVVRFAARDDEGLDHRQDWLDLEVLISVDGDSLALPALLAALTRGESRVILRTGVHIEVDRPEFAHLAELVHAAAELHDQPAEGVRVSHHDLGLWDELAEIGIVDAQASQWVEAARALRASDTLPAVVPVDLKADLRPYQLDGFRWLAFLWESRLGGILADDMGLGKTLQTLALVAHARAADAAPFLVVAPTSVVSMWAHESEQFTPGLDVRVVAGSQARRGSSLAELCDGADLVITSYTLYRMEADDYLALDWGGLVLDEAQTVKNHLGKTYQAIRRLDVPFRVALTGTPMENRLMELWSLLSIVAPGLYPYPQRFVELVANPVERLGDSQVLERFRRRVRPFMLRRTKDLVAAELPEKQEQVLDVRLTPRHRRIYDTHLQRERQTVLGLVDDFDKHRIAIFRSLTRLRQLSLDPALVDEEYDGVGSAKVDVLVDHLAELAAEGHRALVFSQFTTFLGRVRVRLDREGITSSYLDGSTRDRGAVVSEFKQGHDPVFLISLKAGGVGLTLTEADYVFVLDPWWNPAVEAQAVDRVHRIGQHRPVNVYRLVAEDTVEQKVMELKARKAALFAQVMDGGASVVTDGISADDVRDLFLDD